MQLKPTSGVQETPLAGSVAGQTDFSMPERTGLWLLEHSSMQWPLARRILMSGTDPSAFDSPSQGGLIQVFLQKPFARSRLIDALGIASIPVFGAKRITAWLDEPARDVAGR